MSQLLSDIQNGKALRKVSAAEKKDFSASLAPSDPLFEENQRNYYQSAVLDANLETYYDILQPSGLTFQTQFMPLSKADAEFFVQHFEAREAAISEAMIIRGDTQHLPVDEYCYLTDSLKSRIVDLEQRLQPYIDHMRSISGAAGVFVKFSSRSPKDAVVLQRQRIVQLFHSALAAEAAAFPGGILVRDSLEDKNARIIAMLVAGTQSLMVEDAISAIHLLRTSERIYQDCLLALDQAQRGRFTLNLCVREWSELHPSSEWRCFCRPVDGQITTISQYCYLAHFPQIASMPQETIVARISAYYNEHVRPVIMGSSISASGFCCDISLRGIHLCDSEYQAQFQGWVLELNPLLPSTDGALFSWQTESDIILGTASVEYPVLRLTSKPSAGSAALISSDWKWLLQA